MDRRLGRHHRILDRVTFAVMLSLPPMLSKPGDVHRTAAGMFTISYSCAVIVPTLSGGLWDLTGVPWTVFVGLARLRRRADGAGRRAQPLKPCRTHDVNRRYSLE